MFSVKPSISPSGLKPSDVANGVGQGERGRIGGNKVGLAGNGVRLAGNEVGLGGTGSNWGNGIGLGGNGVGLGGNGVGLGGNGGWIGGERGQTGGVGLGYKRRGQLIWPHSLPLMRLDCLPLREVRACKVHGARRAL